MKTYKQIKRSLAQAERAVMDWDFKVKEALENYAVKRGSELVSLDKAYADSNYDSDNAPLQISNVAAALSQSGEPVYCWDWEKDCYDRKPATRRAIAQIARLEKKLNDWNATRFWLENALDYMGEDGTVYYSEGLEECVAELDKLGHSIR